MPYVNQDSRNTVDKHINAIVAEIRKHDTDAVDGVTNYCVSKIVTLAMRPHDGWNYSFLNKAYGTFLSAGAEFLRRLVVPYEQKKSQALDLPCYQEFTDGQAPSFTCTIFDENDLHNQICGDGIALPTKYRGHGIGGPPTI